CLPQALFQLPPQEIPDRPHSPSAVLPARAALLLWAHPARPLMNELVRNWKITRPHTERSSVRSLELRPRGSVHADLTRMGEFLPAFCRVGSITSVRAIVPASTNGIVRTL